MWRKFKFRHLPSSVTTPTFHLPSPLPPQPNITFLVTTIACNRLQLSRFIDDAYGFALTWNYWFNDAVSTASDLVALQLLLEYWNTNFPGWALSLIFWVVLVAVNLLAVKVYGEIEYWLSLLKVITIIVFIIMGIAVNCGANAEHRYIGGSNWNKGDAPFVGGIGGFASVFVTASFAYGGTESLAISE
jgi:AAT family amino acid transporter